MRMSDLRALLEVYNQKNFTKAADNIGYTLSAVSKQIQRVEKELKVTFFDRNKRLPEITVTPEGEKLIPYVKDILNSYRELVFASKNHTLIKSQNLLNIWFPPLIGTIGEVEIMSKFCTENSDIIVETSTPNNSLNDNILRLAEGKLDGIFLFVMGNNAQSFSIWNSLCSEDFSIIKVIENCELKIGVSLNSKFANVPYILLQDLKKETFIFSNSQKNPYDSQITELQRIGGINGSEMKQRFMDFSKPDLVLKMVENNVGVLPQIVLPLKRGYNIRYIPVKNWSESTVGIFISRRSNKSNVLNLFTKYVIEYSTEHISKTKN